MKILWWGSFSLSFAVSPSFYQYSSLSFTDIVVFIVQIRVILSVSLAGSGWIIKNLFQTSVSFGRLACCHEERGSEKVAERDREMWRRVDDRVRETKRETRRRQTDINSFRHMTYTDFGGCWGNRFPRLVRVKKGGIFLPPWSQHEMALFSTLDLTKGSKVLRTKFKFILLLQMMLPA